MKRKLGCIALPLCMAICMTACGGADTPKTDKTQQAQESAKEKDKADKEAEAGKRTVKSFVTDAADAAIMQGSYSFKADMETYATTSNRSAIKSMPLKKHYGFTACGDRMSGSVLELRIEDGKQSNYAKTSTYTDYYMDGDSLKMRVNGKEEADAGIGGDNRIGSDLLSLLSSAPFEEEDKELGDYKEYKLKQKVTDDIWEALRVDASDFGIEDIGPYLEDASLEWVFDAETSLPKSVKLGVLDLSTDKLGKNSITFTMEFSGWGSAETSDISTADMEGDAILTAGGMDIGVPVDIESLLSDGWRVWSKNARSYDLVKEGFNMQAMSVYFDSFGRYVGIGLTNQASSNEETLSIDLKGLGFGCSQQDVADVFGKPDDGEDIYSDLSVMTYKSADIDGTAYFIQFLFDGDGMRAVTIAEEGYL